MINGGGGCKVVEEGVVVFARDKNDSLGGMIAGIDDRLE